MYISLLFVSEELPTFAGLHIFWSEDCLVSDLVPFALRTPKGLDTGAPLRQVGLVISEFFSL